jgi:hypothetical protein
MPLPEAIAQRPHKGHWTVVGREKTLKQFHKQSTSRELLLRFIGFLSVTKSSEEPYI